MKDAAANSVLVLAVSPVARGFAYAAFEGPQTLLDWGRKEARVNRYAYARRELAVLVGWYRPELVVLEGARRHEVEAFVDQFERHARAGYSHRAVWPAAGCGGVLGVWRHPEVPARPTARAMVPGACGRGQNAPANLDDRALRRECIRHHRSRARPLLPRRLIGQARSGTERSPVRRNRAS